MTFELRDSQLDYLRADPARCLFFQGWEGLVRGDLSHGDWSSIAITGEEAHEADYDHEACQAIIDGRASVNC